jgi:hypothetical protein
MFRQNFLLICGVLGWGVTSPTQAQVPIAPASVTRDYVFPPIGLGASETASITIVNAASVASSGATVAMPATGCTGTISFSNPNGPIGTPAPFTVQPAQFLTVTLPFASAGLPGTRGEIQGKVSLTTSTATSSSCSLMLSLETYDSNTGVTHAVLNNTLTQVEPVGPILPIAMPSVGRFASRAASKIEVCR